MNGSQPRFNLPGLRLEPPSLCCKSLGQLAPLNRNWWNSSNIGVPEATLCAIAEFYFRVQVERRSADRGGGAHNLSLRCIPRSDARTLDPLISVIRTGKSNHVFKPNISVCVRPFSGQVLDTQQTSIEITLNYIEAVIG
jgi:hypothetical protein